MRTTSMLVSMIADFEVPLTSDENWLSIQTLVSTSDLGDTLTY